MLTKQMPPPTAADRDREGSPRMPGLVPCQPVKLWALKAMIRGRPRLICNAVASVDLDLAETLVPRMGPVTEAFAVFAGAAEAAERASLAEILSLQRRFDEEDPALDPYRETDFAEIARKLNPAVAAAEAAADKALADALSRFMEGLKPAVEGQGVQLLQATEAVVA